MNGPVAVFAVTTPLDDGPGSLREAIRQANAAMGPCRIVFGIGSGPQVIQLASALPEIANSVALDATSQPGFAGSPLIQINGEQAGPDADGLMLISGECIIRGLEIVRFGGRGVILAGAGGHRLACNIVGTDIKDSADKGNTWGVEIRSPNNVVGGPSPSDANTISGNTKDGLLIVGSGHNVVQGNFIGTGGTGTSAVANGWHGVLVYNSPHNTIGGGTIWTKNVISGNGRWGVRVAGTEATRNRVSGNFIGTDISGTYAVPNGRSGVLIYNAPSNVVGGSTTEEGNLISGNARQGVNVDGASLRMEFEGSPLAKVSTGQGDCHDNLVAGNRIGTDITGTRAIPNGLNGVLVFMAQRNTIGGAEPGAGNLISGNLKTGVNVMGANPAGKDWRTYMRWNFGDAALDLDEPEAMPAELDAHANIVAGNVIGLDVSGTQALGNGESGIAIHHSSGNVIGGIEPAAANVVSCNGRHGVHVMGSTAIGNEVYGNLIGCDAHRQTALGNSGEGVRVHDGSQNRIGGDATGQRNVITGNKTCDVAIHGEQATANTGRNDYTLEAQRRLSPAELKQRVRVSRASPGSNDIA